MSFSSNVLTSRFIAADQGNSPYLMLVLHGRGDSLEGFTFLPEMLQEPALNYLLVNAPDDWYGGFSWYDLESNQKPGVERSAALLNQLLLEVEQAGYLASDMFLFGFSQGCLMSLEWGLRTQKPFRGIVGVSGYCLDAKKLEEEAGEVGRQTPCLVTHGYEDEVLPYRRTEAQMDHLSAHGFKMEMIGYHKGHTIDPYHEFPHIQAWVRNRLP